MVRIICNKCKNAYLEKTEEGFMCPSCNAVFSENEENLLLGIQYYNEGSFESASDNLMKALVKDGSNCKALFYKGLCDGAVFDEDTLSLSDTYKKLEYAFQFADDSCFAELVTLANNEMQKIEEAFTQMHVGFFETADAERIKKEVEFILKIRDEALEFRKKLSDLGDAYNERNERKITLNLSKCYYVSYESANEIGDKKLQKIKDDIASHTVFTGILSADIRSLEIYYRCIVMFFEKSKVKYDFLIENAKKLTFLNGAIDKTKYANVASPVAAAEKLKSAAYDFFDESLKEYDEPETSKPVVEFEEIEEEPLTEETAEEVKGENVEAEEIKEDAEAEDVEAEDVEAKNVEAETVEEVNSENGEIIPEENEEEIPETSEESSEESSEETEDESEVESEVETAEETTEEIPDNEANTDIPEESTEEDEENDDESIDISSNSLVSSDSKKDEKPSVQTNNDDIKDGVSENDGIVEIPVSEQDDNKEPKNSENDNSGETDSSNQQYSRVELTEEAQKIIDKSEKAEAKDLEEAEEAEKSEEYETTLKPKKKKKHVVLILFILILIGALGYSGWKYAPGLIDSYKYKNASTLLADGKYQEAAEAFKALGEYSDSQDKSIECTYENAEALMQEGKYEKAADLFASLGEYKDCATKILSCKYEFAKVTLEAKNYDEAKKLFKEIKDYGDSGDMIKECSYQKALSLIENKKYEDAVTILLKIKKYSDSAEKINECKYLYVTENLSKDNKTTVKYIKELAALKYRNSAELKKELLGDVSETGVKVLVNTSKTDTKTAVTSVSRSNAIYFHVIADSEFYGNTVTLSYTTQYGYTQKTTATLTKENPHTYILYPSSSLGNYTVTFAAVSAAGENLGSVTVNIT